jgi:ABC-type transporter Mla subunit MlaD
MCAALALALFVFFLTDLRGLFHENVTLHAIFPRAPRLRVGSPVWIGGHRVGRVSGISFRPVAWDSAPNVDVRLEIPREHQSLIRRGSHVRLTSARLIGEPAVDIAPGDSSQPVLRAGDTLYAPAQSTARQALASLRAFQRSLDSLMRATQALTPNVELRTAQYQHLASQIDNVQTEFGGLRRNLAGGSIDAFLNGSSLQHALTSLSQTAARLGPALSAAAGRLNDPALRQSFARLRQNADSLAATLARLNQQTTNGSLARFSRDSALSKALHVVQLELDSLIAETRRSPLRFWLGDRKRGRQ